MKRKYLFTSESVSNGHPDKIADSISDAVLDAYLEKDSKATVACETLVTENYILISGEFHTTSEEKTDVEEIARRVVKDIGYNEKWEFDPEKCLINSFIKRQASDILMAVIMKNTFIGAGDQGMMFGYACNETPELMPLPIMLAHKLMLRHKEIRSKENFKWLGPDAKSQVTIQYEDFKPVSVDTVVLSSLLDGEADRESAEDDITNYIIYPVIPEELIQGDIKVLVNPSGRFSTGGPKTDTGLTGRKIIVDTYGGSCPHGGGAFSGKDPTKVDRSGAYLVRYIAKNIVAAEIAERCLVQIAYVIGRADPASLFINTSGTGKFPDAHIEKSVREIFDLTPGGIIEKLNLRMPIYSRTTNFGHFGRELPEFSWEKTDRVSDLKNYFNI